jgi:hypothetical protein
MRLIAFALASLCLSSAAWAGQSAASAPATAAATVTTASADKVYPPLPTLAMLPPATSDDDDLPSPRSTSHGKKKTRQHDCRCAMPTPRLVVSEESRAYLKDIERQLDSALAQ